MKTGFKQFFQSFITSNFIYYIFVKWGINNNYIKKNYGFISVSDQSKFLKALIFFGFYERKERVVIRKYLRPDYDIIELGASLGIITLNLCKYGKKRVFSVEANPFLIKNLYQTKIKNNLSLLKIYSRAISYKLGEVNFQIDLNNLGSKISENKGIQLQTIRLEDIYYQNNINKFILVSDIEGSEIELILFLEDNILINNCIQIIIELHDTFFCNKFYSIETMVSLISTKFNMKIVFNHGNIYVFEKPFIS
jgi:FkbM family methyltransferase